MTIIQRISLYTHCNDLQGKVWNPTIHWKRKYAVFVVIEDSQGLQGSGECWCFDSAPDALLAFLKTEVLPHFIGQDPSEFPEVCSRLRKRATLTARHGILASALSGIDIAFWDLKSRQAGQPLYKLINSAADDRISLYASGGLYAQGKSSTDLAQEMLGFALDGFALVKMKVGALPLKQDIDRVLTVFDALPSSTRLIIDAVYSYREEQAMMLYSALPTDRLEAFQAPVAATDVYGMQRMTQAGVPVMVAEAEYREEIHRELIECQAVKFLQCSPIACGGITRLSELADQLSDSPVRLSLEVSSTAIAMMTACHVAAACEQVAHVEWHSVHKVFYKDMPLGSQANHCSEWTLPAAPGLGMSLPVSELNHVLSTGS